VEPGVTHEMNVLEPMVSLLRLGVPDPLPHIETLGLALVPTHRQDLKLAARRKASTQGRERNLSYLDVLGYAVAQRLGYAFLTGDQGFRSMTGVDFRMARA
jgi:hypothetical protein